MAANASVVDLSEGGTGNPNSKKSGVRIITKAELAKNNKEGESLWIAINGSVYDVTKFAKVHPGGPAVLNMVAGQDCTSQFFGLHSKDILSKPKYKKLKIGELELTEDEKDELVPETDELLSEIPYAEIPTLRDGWEKAEWFTESHRRFFEAIRVMYSGNGNIDGYDMEDMWLAEEKGE